MIGYRKQVENCRQKVAQLLRAKPGNITSFPSTSPQDTRAWQEQAIHHFQGGGLARATTAQEYQGFSGFDIETEIVQDIFLTDAGRNLSEGDKRTHELEATFPLQLSRQVFRKGHRACDALVSGFGASRVWVTMCSCRSHDSQVLVHELHRHRPLPHRRGDALDRAEPHVARGEDAGTAGLE